MLEIEKWPELDQPVLVIALSGWVDAGLAGAGATAVLAGQLEAARRFGRVPLDDLADLQQTRPTVELVDGATRRITWPSVDLVAGRAERDVVLCTGPEPSVRWRGFTEELVGAAKRLDVTTAVTLAGMPAIVSHRRPVPVLATATNPSLAQEVGARRTDYSGPTGAQTVLQVALAEAGIPALGLWAQVPHYVSGNPSPPAIRALLERLRGVAGVAADLAPLDAQADEYAARVEEGLADRPDVAELVEAIESGDAGDDGPGDVGVEDVPSGDELASEIERFLRDQ